MSPRSWTYLLSFLLVPLLVTNLRQVQIWQRAYTDRAVIDAGEFLASTVKPGETVLAGRYAYIPREIKDARIVFTFSQKAIDKADYLVLEWSIPGRHIWPKKGSAEQFHYGNFDISEDQIALLRPVFEERGWQRIWDDPQIRIFKRLKDR